MIRNMELPSIGVKYRHYRRGTEYRVTAIGLHSETGEVLIVYEALYADPNFPYGQIWVRPAGLFLEEIEPGIRRFTPIENVKA